MPLFRFFLLHLQLSVFDLDGEDRVIVQLQTGNMRILRHAAVCQIIDHLIDAAIALIDALCCEEGLLFHPCVSISATSYRLISSEEVEITVELLITGTLCCNTSYTAVSEIDIDEKTRVSCNGDPAIRLYYAAAGERVWEIAKQYRTDVASVLSENELETDTLAEPCVLLIPSSQTLQEEA